MSYAVPAFFADAEESPKPVDVGASTSQNPVESEYTGPRTLDGRPAPHAAAASARSSKPPQKKKGLATLSSLGGGPSHDHDDDDDDDDDDDESERKGPRDLFAGGEKSGLAVQDPARHGSSDPKKVIKDILAKAKAYVHISLEVCRSLEKLFADTHFSLSNAKRADSEDDVPHPSRPSNFHGAGVTVGGEGTESRRVPDPRGPTVTRAQDLPVVTRTLHLWRDGFSIEDGPLRRYTDPEHAMDLQMIRSGRAPLHLMDVEQGQRCDVRLQQHEEDWHQLPRIYRPFGGQGRRLGSPVPGDGSSSSAPPAAAASAPVTGSTQSAASSAAPANVDDSQPTVAIRFQMPDGSRLPARFNLTNTIGDLYEFASSASPDMRSRAFVIQSTFPSKEYTEKAQKLEEVDAFKRGGIAVVKWA